MKVKIPTLQDPEKKPKGPRAISPAFKPGALAHLLAHRRNARNFKLAKSFEEGAASRSFYKDR